MMVARATRRSGWRRRRRSHNGGSRAGGDRTVAKYVVPPARGAPADRRHRDTLHFNDLENSSLMMCGDADRRTEKLSALIKGYGCDERLRRTRMGGLETREVPRPLELMTGPVMPRMRAVAT